MARLELIAMNKVTPVMAQPSKSQPLTSGWSFKQTDTDEWLSVARVPTNVHLDLLNHEKYDATTMRLYLY